MKISVLVVRLEVRDGTRVEPEEFVVERERVGGEKRGGELVGGEAKSTWAVVRRGLEKELWAFSEEAM